MENVNGAENGAARARDWLVTLFRTERPQLKLCLCFLTVFMGVVLSPELRFEMNTALVRMAPLVKVIKNISGAATLDTPAWVRLVSNTTKGFKVRTSFDTDFLYRLY